MPLEIPPRSDIVGALQAYVRTHLPDLDPTVTRRRGFIGGMVRSLGSALHDWYVKLKRYADREPFPQKASENFLIGGWWADITKLERLPASAATGKLVVTGIDGSIIPAATNFTINNKTYTVVSSSSILAQSLIITSLTRSGTTAIAETASAHFLASGMAVTVSGAVQTQYNGLKTITVTADNEFTFEVTGSPATPATGSPALAATWGNVVVICTEKGQDTNVDAGATMTLASVVSGVDNTARVTFGTIGGGSDVEDIENYRDRLLEALGTDFGMFSSAEIKIVSKQIAGVTRVWVIEATADGSNGVLPGQVKIYFMRDNDANPFPSTSEIDTVKTHIVDLIMPAHTSDEDVMVYAPTKRLLDIYVDALDPDTPSMRMAIKYALAQFFDESADLGVDITEDDIRCAVRAAFDPERRQYVRTFTISSPAFPVVIPSNELPVLGTVIFT